MGGNHASTFRRALAAFFLCTLMVALSFSAAFAEAVSIETDTLIDSGDAAYDGADLTIGNGTDSVTVTINGLNDVASISGDNAGNMTEDDAGDSGVMAVRQPDDIELSPPGSSAGCPGRESPRCGDSPTRTAGSSTTSSSIPSATPSTGSSSMPRRARRTWRGFAGRPMRTASRSSSAPNSQ